MASRKDATKKGLKSLFGAALIFSAGLSPVLAFDNTNILVEEAVNHIYQQRYKQAHQALKNAYEQSPRHPGVHFNLGRLFELTGNFSEALKEYRLAAGLDTSMVAARRGIARCVVELKRIKAQQLQTAARQEAQKPINTQENRPVNQPARIVTQKPAVAPARVIIQQTPSDAEITSAQNLRLPPLPKTVTRAVSKPSEENRAEKLLESGKTQEAIDLLNKILQSNPDSPQAHFLLGKALSLKGDLFSSIKHLEEALRVDEKYYDAYVLLGRNYAKVNLLEDAIKNYQIYYGVRPQASVALEIARIYESMGNPAKAREYYARANAMNPGNPNLQARLNETTGNLANDLYLRANHAFTTENYQDAVNLFTQAIETSGLLDSYRRDALRKVEVARFKLKEIQAARQPAQKGFKSTRKTYGTVNLLYPQLADINFKTRFTGPVTVEWRGYIARKIKRYGRDFLLMIKDLSRDELDMMRKDRNDFRLNKHFNNQPVFLLAATQGGFPPFAKEGEIITFTGTTDWKTYNIINDMGQTVALPSLTFISAYPDPE
jgi:tetratricopeptide (TPR) repeat protein